MPAVPGPASRGSEARRRWWGRPRAGRRELSARQFAVGLAFLAPALFVLAALVVYPIGFTVVRSLFDRSGDRFVWLDNYREMFSRSSTRTAIRNNAIWVVVAPMVVTAVGLVFAVLTERIRFSAAFKAAVFMPMAISFLAAGVIFRFVYEQDPDRGLANAALTAARGVFEEPGRYPGARPSVADSSAAAPGGGFQTVALVRPGERVDFGLVAIAPGLVPDDARPAADATGPGAGDELTGAVWLDFTLGGGGERGRIDPTELGLPSVLVQAVRADGGVAGSDRTDGTGRYSIGGLEVGQDYRLRVPESNFREAWRGLSWLGPSLVTPSLILAYTWIWAGFAMVVIAAGLSAIPREAQEAARVDGAGEWQVFRRVTMPLLGPVLGVVVVTLAINVMKVFDLVYIIPPTSVQDDANVVALELWRVSFGGERHQGLGSALGVLLFVLVVPFMLLNIRRFRRGAVAMTVTVTGQPPLPAATSGSDRATLSPSPDTSAAGRVADALRRGPIYLFLVAIALVWLTPTLGLLVASLRDNAANNSSGWWNVLTNPSQLTLENYRSLFGNDRITGSVWNTVLIAVPTTVVLVLLAALAGYAFAWASFPGRDLLFLGVVALLVVPLQVALIPVADLYRRLDLFGTLPGVVLFHVAFGLPFAIFLLRNFFAGIPRELMEAARMDGASELRLFFRVVLPLGWPAVASLAIFQFLWTWNDLLVGLVFSSPENFPITVAIQEQTRQFGSNIDVIAPGAFISMAIPLLVFFAFQRFFVQGLLAGSGK